MKRFASILFSAAAAIAFAAESPEPVLPELKDPNPYANYADGMRSDPAHPMAVEWQGAAAALSNALSRAEMAKLVESEASMAALLAQVKEAYATDPVVATQIAAVSQLSMCAKCPKAPKMRARWTNALLEAARGTDDAYRAMFFLDQLRWCGHADDAEAVLAIGAASKDAAVKEFSALVARELKSAE